MIAPVIDLFWLEQHRAEVVLADVRWYLDGRSGQAAYEQGHISGAIFVDLEHWLSGPGSSFKGRHPLPDPADFARGMSELGIGDDCTVVAYDDVGGVIAARLVWMLRAVGKPAALLDGGIRIYNQPLESGTVSRPRAIFSPIEWPADQIADIDDVTDPTKIVLDARNADRYRGEEDHVDPRMGHISGARNLPCRENLTAEGTFLPADTLRRRFRAVGVSDGAAVISYCGSGVTACHNLLALELVGLGGGRLFPGSWSQYSQDASRAISTGSSPE